ncbi:helix-turn-helix transcriptional regulator [Nocardia farcinica]|nr:helix-turn-helix transcriptional regulator [Nocardia farcinica]MBF6254466.1 helix-turn-helix transcriptional regulator [Nocardia farcinica]MBF6373895.1 helix-turn-helix transcriptional regulator [Nocardia farcinica]MBF6411009.1 helix-turn-helix transcriptional regulator [Nocardia farcinica]
MTQEELSRRAQIPIATLRKIEKEQSAIDVEQLNRIAESFGQDMGEFVHYARRNATLYRRDGSLNPADTRGYKVSDTELEELADDDPPSGS